MTEAGSTPRTGASQGTFNWLYAFVDWFVTDEAARLDPDARRRARLLVSSAFLFALPTLAFFVQTRAAPEMAAPIPAAFLVTSLLFLFTPFLLRFTASTSLAGGVLTLVCLAFDLLIAAVSGGFEVSALLWVTTTPLLAAFFVGGRFSVLVAILAAASTTAIFALDRSGFPFPEQTADPDTAAWFALQSLLDVTILVAIVGWLFERQTARGLRQAHQELRQAHVALQEREHRYRSLTEEASDAILVSQADGQFVEVNARACELLGYTRAELQRASPVLLFAGKPPLSQDAAFAQLQDGSVMRFEAVLVRKDGSVFPAEISLRLISGTLIQAIVRDVSERHRYEAELLEAKERAEQMSRLKSAFLANMSHEIRTPLTSILGFAELLAVREGDAHQFAGLIQRNGERLMDTLNSVLDLAQIESGSLHLRREAVDAAARTREAVLMLTPLARERGLYLLTDVPEDAVVLPLDPAALDRVLTNLISNALKFTERGGVTVRVARGEDEVVLEVTDTGIGIDPDFLPHLFDEFEQESQGFRRSHEGVGLGLTITHRLVELLGGRIEVRSEKGRGSTFTVAFPASPAESSPAANAESTGSIPSEDLGSKSI